AQVAATAMRSGQPRPALVAADQAIALWVESSLQPPARAELTRAEALRRLGSFEAAEETARRAAATAKAAGDLATLVEAVCSLSRVLSHRSMPEQSLDLMRDVLPAAEQLGGTPLVVALTTTVGALVDAGDVEGATAAAERALAVADTIGDDWTMSKAV